mmetsp:Transcript_76408/g.166866  ORF Transcript_76408/g.166866 Transcript_76408/m.166866 type:complete len:125 (+) Transcript_76408:173-547(+)
MISDHKHRPNKERWMLGTCQTRQLRLLAAASLALVGLPAEARAGAGAGAVGAAPSSDDSKEKEGTRRELVLEPLWCACARRNLSLQRRWRRTETHCTYTQKEGRTGKNKEQYKRSNALLSEGSL